MKMHMSAVLLVSLFPVLGILLTGCGAKKNSVAAKDYALIDLHLHLDGSLSVASVRNLARSQGIELPEKDADLLRLLQVSEDCRDLNEYLEKFDFPLSLMQTKEGISMAVQNLEQELQAQGLLYAEIRFAPQLHMQQGLTQSQVVEAAIEGMNRSAFRSNLILCCMRGDENSAENLETVRVAKAYLDQGVCAVDLAGAEAVFPTENFEQLFLLADELEVPYTIHAGEADGPQSVVTALEFGTKRIGHGVRSCEHADLLKTLAEQGVTLELCPTSNLNTNIFERLADYPLRKLMQAGVSVTVNTDNMTVSGTTLEQEFRALIDTFALKEAELQQLVRNAVEASFADAQTKQWLASELERRFSP